MIKSLILLVSILLTTVVHSQTVYSKAFGNPNDKPIIYLHGGPGYNAVAFEVTTAEKLSQHGFYVITYDRRGEGRSTDKNATFTFHETFDDLNSIYRKFNLKSATLIGHSFGGVIAITYAEKYPKKTNAVVLTGAPISMQETLSTILKSSKDIYENNKDNTNLNYINMLEKMDKSSIEYSSYCFSHAMQNGFYSPKKPTKEALRIYSKFKTDTLLLKYSSKMTYEAPRGFWKNEKYTTLDLKNNIEKVVKNNTSVFGIYGKNDGLFSEKQIQKIKTIVGETNFEYLNNCSHNAFIDQQTIFIDALKKWIQ